MKFARIALFAVATLVCGLSAKGQGCIPQPNLTASESIYMDGGLTTLYVNSQIYGTVDMSGEYCGFGITHTPSVEAGVADLTSGATFSDYFETGQSVCAGCYINESLTTSVIVNPNDQYRIDQGERVVCSKDGTFYETTHNNDWEEAITYSQNLQTSCGTGCTFIQDWCTDASSPPDYDPNYALSDNPTVLKSPYFNGVSYCYRPVGSKPGTRWQCFTPSPVVTPKSDSTKHTCTNWDKNTKGVYP